MVTTVVHSDEELLRWYRDEYDNLKNSMPAVIERIESMDRSILVAECARLHKNLIVTRQMNNNLRLTLNSMAPAKEGQ